jgi:hypothetical protein
VCTRYASTDRHAARGRSSIAPSESVDYAALRRYVIDEDLMMTREDGVYWRTGGPVDVWVRRRR